MWSVLTGMYCPSSLSLMGISRPVTGSMRVMGSVDVGLTRGGVGWTRGGTGGAAVGFLGSAAGVGVASPATGVTGTAGVAAAAGTGPGTGPATDCLRRGDFLGSGTGDTARFTAALVALLPFLVLLITSSIVSSTVLLLPSFS